MPFRNLIISNPAKISTKDKHLVIETGEIHRVPIEDISSVLIESQNSIITSAALSVLGKSGCSVFVCDEKHLPCALILPYYQHSRQFSMLKKQIAMTETLKNRLWQAIIKAKVSNQAECLKLQGFIDEPKELLAISNTIKTGDPENKEAIAAKKYFATLFTKDFSRSDEENSTNAQLNYGYAILRGSIARSIAVYGLSPSLGIHHKSGLNAFNLADDIIEPFRPVIDLLVSTINAEELTPDVKYTLVNSLNLEVEIDGKKYSVSYAIEKTVQSLAKSIEFNSNELLIPSLLNVKQHQII